MQKIKLFVKKIFCGLLAMMTLFSCVSCSGNEGSGDSAQPDQVSMKSLVVDGETSYCVVISKTATEAEVFAAEELISYAEKVTGAELALKTDADVSYARSLKALCIGDNKLLKQSGIEIDSSALNTDGFIIKNVGEMIFISGAYDRATLYGAYDFIEKYFGVKFLTYDTTYVPEKSDVLIEETLDVTEVPDFEMRSYYASSILGHAKFAAQMRMVAPYSAEVDTYGGSLKKTWYDENFHGVVEYAQSSPVWREHPEWFSSAGTSICYTNGITDNDELDTSMEVSCVKAIIEELKRKILDSSPTQKFFMVGQEDNVPLCTCARCAASEIRNGSKTGMHMVWINTIAKEIEAWAKVTVPNKEYYICTFAYQWSVNAPTKIDADTKQIVAYNEKVIPHKDVYIFWCGMTLCYMHSMEDESCTMNATGRAQWSGWSQLTDKFIVWDYGCNYTNSYWYFPNISSMKENLRTYKKYGAVMVMNQALCFDDNSYEQQLKTYLFSKLMWNIEQDVYDLIHEFNHYYFEEAAEYINDFIDLFERHFAILNIHTELYEHMPAYFAFENYPLELLQTAISYAEDGMKVIEESDRSDAEKQAFSIRFQRVSLQPKNMILKNIDNYGFSATEKKAFIEDFFRSADEVGVTYFGEGLSMNKMKEKYGY